MEERHRLNKRTLRFSHFSIERAPDAILWIDSEGSIYRANSAAEDMFEFDAASLQGQKIYTLSPMDSKQKFAERWEHTKQKGICKYEWLYLSKSGKSIPVEITRNHIEFEGKEYSCSFIRDITERKNAEKALRDALAQVEKLKDHLAEENLYLQNEIKLTHNFEEIIWQSETIKRVLEKVEQVAQTNSTVLISGETGTGKELIARAIHSVGKRRDRTLVKVNCAALPLNLIESELFGHEKGAFTGAFELKIGRFELANHGTIFLDEIGDLPVEIQAKLLRVLQDGEFQRLGNPRTIRVDVRLITATNRKLEESVLNGTFREDLYYRLNVFPIHVPPLRERKEDIPVLTHYFLKKYSTQIGKKIDIVPVKIMNMLQSYSWPGNIRELENIIERAIIMNSGSRLQSGDWMPVKPSGHTLSGQTLADIERNHIIEVLKSTGWQVSGQKGAAKVLGINPNTLVSKMKKLNIRRPGK